MSLKQFHIFFVAVCLGLMAFIARWAILLGMHDGGNGVQGAAVAAASGLALGVPYLVWFVRRYKTLS
jgi:hypothetical protein